MILIEILKKAIMQSANLKIPKRFQSDWILTKIKDFLKNDPYLKNTDWKPFYESLEYCIYSTTSLNEALEMFQSYDFEQALEFSRKTDSNGNLQTYVIPKITFQIESIVDCWDSIVAKYKNFEPLSSGRHFGHRPDIGTYLPYQSIRDTAGNLDRALNSPLKVKFQKQYNCFKQAVLDFTKKSIDKNNEDARALLIQTDIKGFFYALSPDNISKAIDKYAPDLSPCKKYLKILIEQQHDHLPIGWILSGIIVDRLLVEFHKKVDTKLTIITSNYKARKLRYVSAANYVDDFFFAYSINISKQDLLSEEYKQEEKKICKDLTDTINEEIRDVFYTKSLEFYSHGSEKFQVLYFNYRNLDLLETNFHVLMHAGKYSDETDLDIFADLDEKMLPADNDLVLNEKAYFNVLLRTLKKRVIDGGLVEVKETDDIFKKIINKISGPEKKYIIKVIELLETLAFTDKEKFLDGSIKKINELYDGLRDNSAPFEIWLKYFNRLFVFYTRSGFNRKVPFIRQFTDFQRVWLAENNVKAKHDWLLLKSMHQDVLLKTYLERNGTIKFGQSRNIKGGLLSPYELKNGRLYISSIQGTKIECSIFISILKTSLIRINSYNERLSVLINTFKIITDRNLRYTILTNSANSLGIDSLEDYEYFLRRVSGKIHKIDRKRATNAFSLVKKIIRLSSYEIKLKYAKDKDILDKKFLPRVDKSNKSRTEVKLIVDNLILLCCHDIKDIINAVLIFSRPGNKGRFLDRTSVPTTLKGVGLGFYDALRVLSSQLVDVNSGKLASPIQFKNAFAKIMKTENSLYISENALEKFKNTEVCNINVDDWMVFESKYFKRKRWNITLSPLGVKSTDYNSKEGLRFFSDTSERINIQVHTSLNEASKRKSSMLVFPELSIPRKYLFNYIKIASQKKMIFIGGLEYQSDNSRLSSNSTIICIPVNKDYDPFSRSFICFEQLKRYPAAIEQAELKAKKFTYKPGDTSFIFKSSKIGNFANLTCSDFLSLRLRLKVQEKIHFLIVPAQNPDNSTYDHLAQSCIRDLHCFSVICNSQAIGTSLVYGPYYDQTKRTLLKREGMSSPEFATINWSPLVLELSQRADSQKPFRKKAKKKIKKSEELKVSDLKQTPPDWGY